MEAKNIKTEFRSAARPTNGIALIFDIAGFTNFINKPDIQRFMTEYINFVISCVETCIYGGEIFWLIDEESYEPLEFLPITSKYLGDGMLYVWEYPDSTNLSADFYAELINRFWFLQNRFSKINDVLIDRIPVAELPEKIKIGIAEGTLIKLTKNDNQIDYIGICINLASRLVKYLPDINFCCSARLGVGSASMKSLNYKRIIATQLRSFGEEVVYIDDDDYNFLDVDTKFAYFREFNSKF